MCIISCIKWLKINNFAINLTDCVRFGCLYVFTCGCVSSSLIGELSSPLQHSFKSRLELRWQNGVLIVQLHAAERPKKTKKQICWYARMKCAVKVWLPMPYLSEQATVFEIHDQNLCTERLNHSYIFFKTVFRLFSKDRWLSDLFQGKLGQLGERTGQQADDEGRRRADDVQHGGREHWDVGVLPHEGIEQGHNGVTALGEGAASRGNMKK